MCQIKLIGVESALYRTIKSALDQLLSPYDDHYTIKEVTDIDYILSQTNTKIPYIQFRSKEYYFKNLQDLVVVIEQLKADLSLSGSCKGCPIGKIRDEAPTSINES